MMAGFFGASTDNRVELPDTINLVPDAGTFCGWGILDTNAGTDPRMLSKASSTSSSTVYFELALSGAPAAAKTPMERIKVGGTTNTVTGGTTFTTGAMHHIAGRRGRSGDNDDVIIDAAQDATAANAGTLDTLARDVWIGNVPTVATRCWDGTIEDVRIYDRALSDAELQCILNGKGHDGIVFGLLHRWTLDEGSEGASIGASTIKDQGPSQSAAGSNGGTTAPTWTGSKLAFRRRSR